MDSAYDHAAHAMHPEWLVQWMGTSPEDRSDSCWVAGGSLDAVTLPASLADLADGDHPLADSGGWLCSPGRPCPTGPKRVPGWLILSAVLVSAPTRPPERVLLEVAETKWEELGVDDLALARERILPAPSSA